jgi:uncharacterized ferritin-like protein (DUF455 family)
MSSTPGEGAELEARRAPPPGTVERWAWDYVLSVDLEHKLRPPEVPSTWEAAPAPARRIARPGRPAGLSLSEHAPKSPGPEALRKPARRAQLVHAFLHHELQAAELMAWALLAFPETPRAFRGGLIHIALDEIRHMTLYADYLASLGFRFGDFPVRDWFWTRVPGAASPAHFVAVMGMGFEGGNLDHTARFAERFRAVGDLDGAALQERVCAEEVPHVRFGVRWFRRFTAATDFDTWVRHLPPPLSPVVMRGRPMNRRDRARSGLAEPFLDALAAWFDRAPGS